MREQLDGDIARMFYSAGLPFNLARNPHYKNAFTYACNNNLAGYVPPGYNVIRTKLLQRERDNIEKLLELTRGVWKEKGVTLVCDGWIDPQRRSLINFMAVTESYPMFIKAINCEGQYKDKFFISNLIKEVIMMVGPSNIIQVIIDNAPVCRAAAKNIEANEITYNECHWITVIAGDAIIIRNFIMNHSMRLSMFNNFSNLNMLAVAETRFASVIVMLRRFKKIKNALQAMVISDKWSCYREDDVRKARYSTKEWLQEDPQRVSPQKDLEISNMRKTCLKRYFPNEEERKSVNIELVKFFSYLEDFGDQESLRDRWRIDPKMWWIIHGVSAPLLQIIAIKLLGKVSSSSCCERNWSTYSFIQSMKRNKITPQWAEDLVYVHINLRLLSRKTPTYMEGDNRMWDVAGDGFESF
ncbi:hypothetical protein KFK09_010075 [Dendrobium nobile]|uniref:Uncharacterized protein n=1 Tax=Dendrobium nobile TaxID=94219 RepID=A0A8T3BLA4_DENNO|nr:hypothetical protein KFK09_010075 [Dendrobium nobile]